ncbi:MAG: ATP-binding protein [Planctomycetota bacterium]|nr:ATP-binding protein [Planctomycetota bacterium]
MSLPDYEKLGAFYLGKDYDVDTGKVLDDMLLYDAKDLTTHAVCVGMTGSGKTGLCLSLLEEAAIDGVPAIAIDPKGDLGNLLLSFPGLTKEEFQPWIEEGQATRKGLTVPEYAAKTADLWRNGLASWGQDGERIRRLRDSVDMTIYTPGSDAGLPLTVLRSFAAPSPELLEDGDAMRERVMASVSGLLALLGVDADPIRSREHILLSNILDRAWRDGRDLDLGSLIQAIQEPPFERIGVMDLEAFYPAKDRFGLAMTLNNLLASPGFSAWMEGEPLDVQRLLWTPEGKPRLTIVSIAHLSDSERMFFVTLLLNEVVAWMRTQPGATTLRALLYMDEVFGFFPPSKNPPSKTPMLTLMKQARAFGLGVVLATQNPVDLDYKGLSNAGTWFLGRLQTERDKARVLDGLEGASATTGGTFDRRRVEAILSGMRSRVFYMNNVHDDGPTVFHTRWAMSYLRGPLTRAQIKRLMEAKRDAAKAATPGVGPEQAKGKAQGTRPVVPPAVPEAFVLRTGSVPDGSKLVYRPALLGRAKLHYAQATRGIDLWKELSLLAPLSGRVPADPWTQAQALAAEGPELDEAPDDSAGYAKLPGAAAQAKSYRSWKTVLKSFLYRECPMPMWRCKPLKLYSEPEEIEGDFVARVAQAAREKRDLEVEKLRNRYTPKLDRVQERIRKAEQKIGREKDQYKQAKQSSWISVGTTVLGALFGRKVGSIGTASRAGTAARGMGRASKEKQDVERAKADLDARHQDLAELEEEFREKTDALKDKYDPANFEIEAVPLRPRKADIAIEPVVLAWTPWTIDESGMATPAFRV